MSEQPTITLEAAIDAAENIILTSHYGSAMASRNRANLAAHVGMALSEVATVPARAEDGKFIADDPATPNEDESRQPAPKAKAKKQTPKSKKQ